MSILIRGMEMPSKCIECKLMRRCGKDDLDYVCMPARVYVEDLTNAYKPRPEYCPLVEIPPHGRLIDADALRQSMYHEAFETDSPMQKWDSGCWIRYKMFERLEGNAPTIIEAEEGNTWI